MNIEVTSTQPKRLEARRAATVNRLIGRILDAPSVSARMPHAILCVSDHLLADAERDGLLLLGELGDPADTQAQRLKARPLNAVSAQCPRSDFT